MSKRHADYDSDESSHKLTKRLFGKGDIISFLQALPKFHSRLQRVGAIGYVLGEDRDYQTHMKQKPTYKDAAMQIMLAEADSTITQWVLKLRLENVEILRESMEPWEPHLWSGSPLPQELYVNGELPEGCIAGTPSNPAIPLTDEEVTAVLTNKVNVLVPYPETDEQYEACLRPAERSQAKVLLGKLFATWNTNGRHLMEMHQKTYGVFCDSFSPTVLSIASEELNRTDYPAAYHRIRTHYMKQGISRLNDFSRRERDFHLMEDQTLDEFFDRLRTVLYEKALMCVLSEDPTQLPDNDMLLANSWDLTDAEIRERGYPVHVKHTERLNLIIDAVHRHPTRKYDTVLDIFESGKREDKTIPILMDRLLHAEMNKRRKTDEPPSYNANQSSRSKAGSHPKGSCRNHPNSTSHTTAQCNMESSSNGKSQRRRNTEKYCKHCAQHKPSIKNTHNTAECRLAPSKPTPQHTKDGKHTVNDKVMTMLTKQSEQIAKNAKMMAKLHSKFADESDSE